MNLKDNLKKLRKDNNLSQEDLAEKLNVSRQAVSKWEQGIAYPEMDKVLQLCKMFNMNIDEFLNQDISKAQKNNDSKVNVNKYIDDFLSYVTKTVKMFSSMSFKSKIKCLFEQFFIIIVLMVLTLLLNGIYEFIIGKLIMFLEGNVYFAVLNIFEAIFFVAAFILDVTILLHIFKIRYLDYFEYSDNDSNEDEDKIEDNNIPQDDNKEVKNEAKKEKVIIRDANHSGYKFINGIVKVFIFIVKCFAIFTCFMFSISLVSLACMFAMSFMFIKTGLLFVGVLLLILSMIAINILIIYIIYNFIVNKKVNKTLIFVILIASLLVGGASVGLILTQVKDFKVVDEYDSKYITTKTESIKMNDKYIIYDNYNNINFFESDNNDLKIEYIYPNYCDIYMDNDNENGLHTYMYCNDFDYLKRIINGIENKEIIDSASFKVNIYTNKENIEKLKNNIGLE